MVLLRSSLLCRAALVLALFSLPFSSTALAAESSATEESTAARTSSSADLLTTRVGPVRISLDTSSNAIPVGGEFRFGAKVSSTEPLEYLQARVKLFMPSGSLIYQKTFVDSLEKPGSVSFEYGRTIGDIDLETGVYPVEFSARFSAGGEVTETVVPASLLVYDPRQDPLAVSIVARVSAQPLSDPEGRFTSDPAQFVRARDDVTQIADWVLSDTTARVGLCLSPMMLEEWQRISEGYSFVGAEGETSVSPSDDVPQAYGLALETISRALATGRLEVLSLGYSDPDLSELNAAGLLGDVTTQYSIGRSRSASALEATPSAGTAPAGFAVPQDALAALASTGIEYVIVNRSRATTKGDPVPSGSYHTSSGDLVILAADTEISRSLAASSSAELRPLVFGRYARTQAGGSLPLLVEVGPGSLKPSQLIANAKLISAQRWATLELPKTSAEEADGRVRVRAHRRDRDAPADYWRTVSASRAWSRALVWALGTNYEEALRANRSSLVAESSVWSGFGGQWTLSGKGLTYAASARRSADRIFDQITMTSKPITLAGASGRVPVTIVNETDERVRARLTMQPGPSLELQQGTSRILSLEPGENFVEIPVLLNNTLQGRLRLGLEAGGVEFEKTSVTLRASYLDRLAIIAGILVLLAGLLGYIIVRVRSAEADAPEGEAR
ncbi:MAG TPA: hypothetical protein VLA05_02090 [Coriobacteriia bacterium]|nr:hypothetical protein [Coriobacteriia bacterium]